MEAFLHFELLRLISLNWFSELLKGKFGLPIKVYQNPHLTKLSNSRKTEVEDVNLSPLQKIDHPRDHNQPDVWKC